VNGGYKTFVDTEIMSRILAAFAEATGIDEQHPALLIL